MIRIVLYQNTNQKIAEACGKCFPRVVSDETIGLEELAAHMASHNTPYSKGAILGLLTDAAACTKELLLLGKNVKGIRLGHFDKYAFSSKPPRKKKEFCKLIPISTSPNNI